MQIKIAGELTEDIMARFRMCGIFVDDAMRRAYFNVLIAYDDAHGANIVRQMLKEHERPVTDAELDRMLMPPAQPYTSKPSGPVSDPARGRRIMRQAYVDSWCERHGGTEADFWKAEEALALKEKRPTLRQVWDRTDRVIADRKKRGMPVDESGLTQMAAVGPDPFADEPTAPIAKPIARPKETAEERAKREQICRDAEAKIRRSMSDPLSDFFPQERVA